METKICTKCKVEKNISFFSKKNKLKDGTQKYNQICKKCINENNIIIRNNSEFKKNRVEYDKLYYTKNREQILENKKEYHINNKEEILEKKRNYRSKPENKERANEYFKKYRIENKEKYYEYRNRNPHIIAWRRILYRTLQYLGKKKEDHTIFMLGYSAIDLRNYLESLFKEGMSWDNYGLWEIDHKRPLTSFDENSSPSEVNALSNLQPLWKEENIKKYNHII